jgi:hypothetical protein
MQYVSIRYTERLAEAGIEPSVGSVGDSYDNALAETVNGLYKAEVIHRRGPWRSFEAVEFATLEWVDWFNNRRLLETSRPLKPSNCLRQSEGNAHWRRDSNQTDSDKPGTVHFFVRSSFEAKADGSAADRLVGAPAPAGCSSVAAIIAGPAQLNPSGNISLPWR